MENLQEQVNKLSQTLHELARQQGLVLEDEPSYYDPYSYGYSHAAPICHICGIHGHTPADCQHGCYSPTPDCFGMNFAQQHGSYHNNSSPGWPENPSMTYGNSSPPISSFSPSDPMQEFRCAEENHFNQHQYYAAPAYAPQFHQEQPQISPLAEQSSWLEEVKKKQQELMDQMNSQTRQLNERFPQTEAPQPVHQLSGSVPMELNGPPQVQEPTTTTEFDDTEKLSLLCLEYTWSAEGDPLRPVLIKEMKKIKDGRDLIEELKKIEKNMKLNNTVSFQLELEYEEAAAAEDGDNEEIQVVKDVVIQEHDETGLSNPLDDMFPSEHSVTTLHCMIPSLKEEMKNDLPKLDNAHSLSNIAYAHDDNTYYSYDGILLKDACSKIAYNSPVDAYHYNHVIYCYTYIIGYSIDDLVGVNPITCASFCLCECTFRSSRVHYSSRPYMVRLDIPWDPGGFMEWC